VLTTSSPPAVFFTASIALESPVRAYAAPHASAIHASATSKVKRLVDILGALVGLVITALVAIPVTIAIYLNDPGPIFYSQVRNGLHGKPFRVYKFRSMYKDAEKRGVQWAQERDPRITRVGYWIRVLRIDELPQIWN